MFTPHIVQCLLLIVFIPRDEPTSCELLLTRSIPGYDILVLLCQRLPAGVRVYSYLQSHASS